MILHTFLCHQFCGDAGHQILADIYFWRRNAPAQLTELRSEHYIVPILTPSIAVSSYRDEKSLAVPLP